MKISLFLFITFFLLLACAKDSGVNSEKNNSSQDCWAGANFIPDKESLYTSGSGLQRIVHSGSWLMLEDAWSIPAEGKSGYLVHAPRLFVSAIDGNRWDTLSVPSKGFVNKIFADSTGFFVGTTNGDLLKYLPDRERWERINVLDSSDGVVYTVYGISKYEGNLIVSLAGFKDSISKEIVSVVRLQKGSSWIDLETPPLRYETSGLGTVPFQFHKGVELNGNFYAATMDGVFELTSGARQWKQLPFPPKVQYTKQVVPTQISEILVHKNNLVIVDELAELVYEWDASSNNWRAIDSLVLSGFDKDTLDYRIRINTPRNIHSLVSDGKHLFAAGKNSYPKVYMGDYGEPYGNIKKGWRSLGGDSCGQDKRIPTTEIYSLDIYNGILYAASYEGLFKISLKNLDKMIADEKDFF